MVEWLEGMEDEWERSLLADEPADILEQLREKRRKERSMTTPTEKAPEIDAFIKDTTGIDRKAAVTSATCPFCGASGLTQESFKDELSWKEFTISGLCQSCQDKTFG